MHNESVQDHPTNPRLLVATLCYVRPGAEAALSRFRQQAAKLFEKYDLRVERALLATGKGQLVGKNSLPQPELLQIISFPSAAVFQAYASDPEYLKLARERDAHLERLSVAFGTQLDVSQLAPTSDSPVQQRLYGLACVRFLPDGAQGLDEFNRRATGLFARHGMHVEHMFNVVGVSAPLGERLPDFQPERVIVFYLDEPAALGAYASDPEYKELAPVRDRGLLAYDFFLGKVPA